MSKKLYKTPSSSEILIFQEMKNNLKEILKSDQDLAEQIIKKRNLQIKCLESDKQHIYTLYNEAKQRYEEYYDLYEKEIEKNKEKIDIINNLNIEIEKYIQEIYTLRNKNTDLFNIYEQLKNKHEKNEKELNESKITVSILNNKNSKSIRYNIELLVNKFPNNFIKYILKFLVSQTIYQYTIFLLICILFIASCIGWPAVFSMIKGFIAIF